MANGNKSQSDARKNTEQYRNKYEKIIWKSSTKDINFKRRRENNG